MERSNAPTSAREHIPSTWSGGAVDDVQAVGNETEELRQPIYVDRDAIDGQADYQSSGYPHIGLIRVHFNGKVYTGSGTLIADGRCVLTCAHNVIACKGNKPHDLLWGDGLWFEIWENKENGGSVMKRRYNVNDRVVHPRYFDNPTANSGFDLALCWIEVPTGDNTISTNNIPVPTAEGHHFTKNSKLAVVGFPGEPDKAFQKWGMATRVPCDMNWTEEHLEYTVINTTKGQSGSPVMHIRMGELRCEILAVHTGGHQIFGVNYATNITRAKLEWIQESLGIPWTIKHDDHGALYLAS